MVLASAQSYADVSSLDFPDNGAWNDEWVEEDRFLFALRNALRYLDSTGDDIDVRFMFGWVIDDFSFDDMLYERSRVITDGVSFNTNLNLYFAGLAYDLISWNHSKIIVADGEHLITGGINFYSTDYLYTAPVQDISVRLNGQPALDAHRYLDQIWVTFEVDWNNWAGDFDGVFSWLETVPDGLSAPLESPASYTADYTENLTGAPLLSLGRLGLIDRGGLDDPSPSDDAIMAAMAATQDSIKLSLQDIGPVIIELVGYDWNERFFGVLVARALDGVSIEIVISQLGSGVYSYGWTTEDALKEIEEYIEDRPSLKADVIAADGSVVDFICQRIAIATVRINDSDETWGDEVAMGNHSKFFLFDDRAFYIGSQNLYLSNLFEWGVFIDQEDLTQHAIDAYWSPLWNHSMRSVVSGPDATECELD